MLNQFLNQLVKIILIDNAQDSVISVLNDALKVSAERKIQYGYFCKYMDEFIDNQNNKEIENTYWQYQKGRFRRSTRVGLKCYWKIRAKIRQ